VNIYFRKQTNHCRLWSSNSNRPWQNNKFSHQHNRQASSSTNSIRRRRHCSNESVDHRRGHSRGATNFRSASLPATAGIFEPIPATASSDSRGNPEYQLSPNRPLTHGPPTLPNILLRLSGASTHQSPAVHAAITLIRQRLQRRHQTRTIRSPLSTEPVNILLPTKYAITQPEHRLAQLCRQHDEQHDATLERQHASGTTEPVKPARRPAIRYAWQERQWRDR